MKEFFLKILSKNDDLSSKRLIGVLASISLIVYLFINPSDSANNSVLILALGSLGISGFEAIFSKKQ